VNNATRRHASSELYTAQPPAPGIRTAGFLSACVSIAGVGQLGTYRTRCALSRWVLHRCDVPTVQRCSWLGNGGRFGT